MRLLRLLLVCFLMVYGRQQLLQPVKLFSNRFPSKPLVGISQFDLAGFDDSAEKKPIVCIATCVP